LPQLHHRAARRAQGDFFQNRRTKNHRTGGAGEYVTKRHAAGGYDEGGSGYRGKIIQIAVFCAN